ncbi:hypothetical protein [Arthrobacter sp. M4]|uniref:hypothetical protein n=1 Tax=Arthrobacter sp. M4 TaxID=218160 RepID=UPI001CDBFF51|nr:hypothetical protein [Arthrobacter sp. M4]MCA4132966.1 hypothetical protein [Arthrobacter sp. M4]
MNFNRPFTTSPDRYWENVEGSFRTYAKAAVIQHSDGTPLPGVAVFRDKALLGILTTEDALRLSNELVDATERTPS